MLVDCSSSAIVNTRLIFRMLLHWIWLRWTIGRWHMTWLRVIALIYCWLMISDKLLLLATVVIKFRLLLRHKTVGEIERSFFFVVFFSTKSHVKVRLIYYVIYFGCLLDKPELLREHSEPFSALPCAVM